MPLPPIHTAFAYLLKRIHGTLNLPALIVGTMTADLEIPFIWLATGGYHDRLILHSLLGSAVIGTFVSALLTVFVYPIVVSSVFRLNKDEVREKCRFSKMLVFCGLVGNFSHVLIDSLHHSFNPLLYPFVSESFDAFLLTTSFASSTTVVSTLMIVILILVFILEIRKGREGFWKRVFVE